MRRTVCRLSDVPERQGYLVELDGVQVALFRVEGEVHALENACPHRDGPLAYGDVRGGTVYCPLHAWPFDVRTGRCHEFPAVSVRTFRVHVVGDEVQLEV